MPPPPPTSTHTIHAALFRATQPSLGSVVLASLIQAIVRAIGIACMGLRALPAYLPPYMRIVSVAAGMLVGYLESVTSQLSTYALIYIGLTGDPCMPSARRARALTGAVETDSYRQKFRTERECLPVSVCYSDIDAMCSATVYADHRSAHADISVRVDDLPLRCAHA